MGRYAGGVSGTIGAWGAACLAGVLSGLGIRHLAALLAVGHLHLLGGDHGRRVHVSMLIDLVLGDSLLTADPLFPLNDLNAKQIPIIVSLLHIRQIYA